MQSRLHLDRQLLRLALNKKLDRLLRLHHHQMAVLALFEVLFQFVLQRRAHLAVEKVRNLLDGFFASQFAPPRC